MSGASLRIFGLIPALPGKLASSILAINLSTRSGLIGVKEKLPGEIIESRFSCLNWSLMKERHSFFEVKDTEDIDAKKLLNMEAMASEVEADWSPFVMIVGISELDTSDLSLIDNL